MTQKILTVGARANRVVIIMGTRPGIIKMAPLVKESCRRGIDHDIIHTGQHYSANMDKAFFEDMELSLPRYRVDETRKCATHAEQTAEMMRGVEALLFQIRPKVVLVCGDANTNLAAGLAARKLGIIVGHVEAGLRSHDWTMPEEHNRIILDHICELLFAPTLEACRNLVHDNVRGEIHYTGNTIVDATLTHIAIAERKSAILRELGVEHKAYILLTSHREENVDIQEKFTSLLEGAIQSGRRLGKKIIFPAHPRTAKRIQEYGLGQKLQKAENLEVISPLGYMDFLVMIQNAAVILTDSGGVQEEACILHTPCVTLRDNTERPETVQAGANILAGVDPEAIAEDAEYMYRRIPEWENPFGDGQAAVRIVDAVNEVMKRGVELPAYGRKSRMESGERFFLERIRDNEDR